MLYEVITVEQWTSVPKPDNMVNFGMFQDFRTLHGDIRLEEQLRAHLLDAVNRNSSYNFV